MKQIHLIENAEICLRPIEQIAHTVTTPLTKPYNQPRTNTLCDLENLSRTHANSMKILSSLL